MLGLIPDSTESWGQMSRKIATKTYRGKIPSWNVCVSMEINVEFIDIVIITL